jgi:hypothetical protein
MEDLYPNHTFKKKKLDSSKKYQVELNLAIEFFGKEHYVYIEQFHRNKKIFKQQRIHNNLKKVTCSDNGISIIVVPYIYIYHIRNY